MNSRIYTGTVWHARHEPVKHEFEFPGYWVALDLDELPELDRQIPFFGYNRRRLVSIRDADYLDAGPGTIREKLLRRLGAEGCADGIERVILVTSARLLGYVFNPVSFYYALRADGSLRCAVAEVNNTFGDRHLYVLKGEEAAPVTAWPVGFMHPKEFHVSPFNDISGRYRFSFADIRTALDIRVDLETDDGRPLLQAAMKGEGIPLDRASLKRTLRNYPLNVFLVMPRIVWEAAKLYYRKKLKVHHRPEPVHSMTIRRAAPTRLERLYERLAVRFFSQVRKGRLELALPDGKTVTAGDPAASTAVLRIQSREFFRRLILDGDIGFGESFMAGEWTTPDLPGLLRVLADNLASVDDRKIALSWLGRSINRLRHSLRRNTVRVSRRNIRDHYDLSNDFFRLWLDETMMYSCAIFESPAQSLYDAQMNRLRLLIRKARIRPEHHILEIGSGWGSFAIEAARATGCRVTTITLSTQQLELARQRVREAGLADRISVELCDYRHVKGRYDRIVSIEMLEAVGHEYFGAFFRACDRLLKPDGLVVLQVITIPDQRYDMYRRATDWTQKHIFPGGVLPSLTALSRAMTRHSRFVVEHLENIGPHYARTLREWRERFLASKEQVRALGFDDVFLRKWEYYLAYCEAGFAARVINDLHLVLTRPNNPELDRPDSP
ncbi:MAG TPA: DUF1365 family protein [Kiritimatiellia bacterium]|nr:DUF1365 family protein [Kiritimatiellia bacterium]HRZ12065.1 DUF1365 family protein [Kiritimatiellia bacterium]HSA19604.1 DUF1365 family protein [Kiritimatiellia bacterium]